MDCGATDFSARCISLTVNSATTEVDTLCMLTAIAWCAATAAASAAGPVNSTTPSLVGMAQQGQTLTLTPGTWTDATAVTLSDVWESCAGATCSAISPQPGATYTLTAADVGRTIQVVETATATDGTTTATSAPTATVIALPPVNTAPPTIGGTAQEGQVLTLTHGQWSNSPTISDQWERCAAAACSAISGQSGTTYTVTTADAGHTIEVLETATNSGGTTTASSAPTQTIVPPPSEISAPSVVGIAIEGSSADGNARVVDAALPRHSRISGTAAPPGPASRSPGPQGRRTRLSPRMWARRCSSPRLQRTPAARALQPTQHSPASSPALSARRQWTSPRRASPAWHSRAKR